MGFREGEGLGKFGQGRREIVEASTQRGRRGLGLTLKGFQGELNVDWQDEPEVPGTAHLLPSATMQIPALCVSSVLPFPSQPSAVEEVTWFPESSTEMPDAEELADWMTVGEVCFPLICTIPSVHFPYLSRIGPR